MDKIEEVKNMEMDNENANMYFEIGAKLVFLDAPKNFEIGIDFCTWIIGPKFLGIKFIPPGFHFVYYSAIDSSGSHGVRNGFFYYFEKGEVLVKKWDAYNEEIYKKEDLEPELTERIKINIKNIDMNLGTYIISPPDLYKKWRELTRYISPELIKRIAPNEGIMDGFNPINNNQTIEDFEGTLNFTSFDIKKSYPEGATGTELTKYSIDKSYLLKKLIHTVFIKEQNFLGEVELSFIAFLLGQNFSGLEQWKKLIVLICNSDEMISEYPNLYIKFLEVIMFQLNECPTDFFHDIILENNFLGLSLQALIKYIKGRTFLSDVVERQFNSRIERLNKTLKEKFNWEIDIQSPNEYEEEDGEYAPVIVET